MLAKLDQFCPKLAEWWPRLRKLWPRVGHIVQIWKVIVQIWSSLSRVRPSRARFGRCRATFGRKPADCGQNWANVGGLGQKSRHKKRGARVRHQVGIHLCQCRWGGHVSGQISPLAHNRFGSVVSRAMPTPRHRKRWAPCDRNAPLPFACHPRLRRHPARFADQAAASAAPRRGRQTPPWSGQSREES